MKILVIGTGYVGLTTGVTLAYLGHSVTCLDVDVEKIQKLNEGQVPFYEPGLPQLLDLARTHLRFTSSYAEAGIENCDVVFIAVGTPPLADGNADLQYIKSAAEQIALHLNEHYTVIVNKSTVPIGSGNWVGALIRDKYFHSKGTKPTGSFAVASNPEFLRQGSAIFDTLYPDRIIIGADDPQAVDVLTNLYRPLVNQDFSAPSFSPRPEGFRAVPVVTCDLASAELIKYSANAFLALKISYVNEIAGLAAKVGADIQQITRGIGLDKRIGPRFLDAGIGWGGSCFGKDTAALISMGHEYGLKMTIVDAARQVNFQQRTWVVDTLLSELKILKGRTIALLGFTFKPNTDDLRDAPSIDIARSLVEHGALVKVTDPVGLTNARHLYAELGVTFYDRPLEAIDNADGVVLITEWPLYRDFDWQNAKNILRRPLVIDGRNFLDRELLLGLGYRYIGVGR